MDITVKTSSTLRLVVVALSVCCLCACYPRPHRFFERPDISGVLLDNGTPVSGAAVVIAHTRGDDGNYCEGGRAVGVTDATGAFRIDADTTLHLFTSILNPPNTVSVATSVCFKIGANQKLGVVLLSHSDRKTSYVLSCNTSSPPAEFKQDVIWTMDKWGICTNGAGWSKVTSRDP
jgi:hypothetical protein